MTYPFIEINLHSGKGGFYLDGRNLKVYYECNKNVTQINDTELLNIVDDIVEWVNTSPDFPKNDNGDDYQLNQDWATLQLRHLNEEDAKKVRESKHLYNT